MLTVEDITILCFQVDKLVSYKTKIRKLEVEVHSKQNPEVVTA
jgi:hypothetical protein